MQERMGYFPRGRHIDIAWVKEQLKQQRIEPSWDTPTAVPAQGVRSAGAVVTLSDKLRCGSCASDDGIMSRAYTVGSGGRLVGGSPRSVALD